MALINILPFSDLPGTTWNAAAESNKRTKTLTGNTSLLITNYGANFEGMLEVTQDTSGGWTLTINGSPVTIKTSGSTMIGILNVGGVLKFYPEYNTAVAPTTLSDTDAQAYVSAAGITNTTNKNAVNTLFTSLKSNSLYTKMRHGWTLWDTFVQSKLNMKNPVDTDAAGRLVQVGTGTFGAGFTNELTTAGAGLYTRLKPSDINASGLFTRVVSIKNNISTNGVALGVITTNSTPYDYLRGRTLANTATFAAAGNAGVTVNPSTDSTGRWYGVTRSTGCQFFKNGTSLGSATFTLAVNSANEFVIGNGGISSTSTPSYLPDNQLLRFVFFFDELTAAEITTLETILATYENALV